MQYYSSVSATGSPNADAMQGHFENESAYRAAIANDVFLLKFLESNAVENRHGFAKNELYNTPAFIDWISPYFYTSFTTFGKKCIEKANAEDWIAMFDNPILMNDKYKAEAWDFFDAKIRASLTLLETMTEEKPAIQVSDLSRLCNFNFIRIIKKLPAERFNRLMDEYATAIGKAAIMAFKKGERDMAGIYVDNGLVLAFSTSVKNDLEKKRNDIDVAMGRLQPNSSGGYTSTNTNPPSPWGIVRLVILICILIVRLATCRMH